jgi:hypothetical protein
MPFESLIDHVVVLMITLLLGRIWACVRPHSLKSRDAKLSSWAATELSLVVAAAELSLVVAVAELSLVVAVAAELYAILMATT